METRKLLEQVLPRVDPQKRTLTDEQPVRGMGEEPLRTVEDESERRGGPKNLHRSRLAESARACGEPRSFGASAGQPTGMVEMDTGLAVFHSECTVVFSATARQCPRCRRLKCFFVNRDGRTLCAECDGEGRR